VKKKGPKKTSSIASSGGRRADYGKGKIGVKIHKNGKRVSRGGVEERPLSVVIGKEARSKELEPNSATRCCVERGAGARHG